MGIFGFFSKNKKETLDKGLEKTKQNVFSKLTRAIAGKSKVDEEVLDNLEEILISSDVGVDTTLKIIERIEERIARDKYVSTSELNGILKDEIILEEQAQNTHQNAQYTAKIIKQNGYKRIVLTTSKYHQTRARLEFEKALEGSGVEVISAPVSNDPDWSNLWWTNSRGWYLSMSELFGIFRFYIGA